MRRSPVAMLLQAAALVCGLLFLVAIFHDPVRVELSPGYRRILCLGDTITYGLFISRDEAYPRQLEELWNEVASHPRIEVVNLSFPGTNSSLVRRNLPSMLGTFRPDLVLVMVGMSDLWTEPVDLDPEQQTARRSFLAAHSLSYGLFDRIVRALDERKLEIGVDYDPEADEASGAQIRDTRASARFGDIRFNFDFQLARPGSANALRRLKSLEENLQQIALQTESFGAEIWLLTYPSRFDIYAPANRMIRKAAGTARVPLVDMEELFRSLCPEQECPDLMVEGHNPNAEAQIHIAEALMRRLQDAHGFPIDARPKPPRGPRPSDPN